MTRNSPPPPSPDAPPPAITNNEVTLSRFAPPSPSTLALPERSGGMNLFRDGAKKRLSADLPSTGFSPAKKKGGRCCQGAAISPCDIDALTADKSNDNSKDRVYSPSPAYKASCTTTQQPRRKDIKIVLDSSYFFFLQPLTSDKDRFCRGHPQVYSTADIVTFDTNYQVVLLQRHSCKSEEVGSDGQCSG